MDVNRSCDLIVKKLYPLVDFLFLDVDLLCCEDFGAKGVKRKTY